MIDFLFQGTLNNVCISFFLAVAAAIAGITLKRPAITYLMWLLVFLKLLTPPVVSIPALPGAWFGDTVSPTTLSMDGQRNTAAVPEGEIAGNAFFSPSAESSAMDQGKQWLFLTWMTGSLVVFLWSLLHVFRFHRLLGKESEAGSREIQSTAAEIASCLGVKPTPPIYTTSANLSPMVWWIGGKVRIFIPAVLMNQMDTRHLQWILAHELAHVRRRDHIVRWIEWLASVCFWWNPVVWWARYNLRANEELCCDTLVLSSLKPKPYIYGDSLLKAVEILASPARRQPAMASGINGGDLLKRRVRMIVSKNQVRSKLRWLKAAILLGAVFVLPLGLTKAQDGDETVSLQLKKDMEMQEMKAAVRQVEEAAEMGRISEQEARKRLAYLEQVYAQSKAHLVVAEMEEEIARKEYELRDLSETYTQDHPAVIRLRKELDILLAQRQEITALNEAPVPVSRAVRFDALNPAMDYGAVLRDAVEEGMLTEEYIEDKLAEHENARYERFIQALTEAVEAGKITEDEAAAMTAEYIERLEDMREKRQLGRQQ